MVWLPRSSRGYTAETRKVARVYGDEVDPLIMEQVLKHGVFLNNGRYPAGGSLNNRQQPHGFVKVLAPIVDRLQREPGLKIALGFRA